MNNKNDFIKKRKKKKQAETENMPKSTQNIVKLSGKRMIFVLFFSCRKGNNMSSFLKIRIQNQKTPPPKDDGASRGESWKMILHMEAEVEEGVPQESRVLKPL